MKVLSNQSRVSFSQDNEKLGKFLFKHETVDCSPDQTQDTEKAREITNSREFLDTYNTFTILELLSEEKNDATFDENGESGELSFSIHKNITNEADGRKKTTFTLENIKGYKYVTVNGVKKKAMLNFHTLVASSITTPINDGTNDFDRLFTEYKFEKPEDQESLIFLLGFASLLKKESNQESSGE